METVVTEELQNAVDTIVDVSSSYPCSFCKKSFSSNKNLYRHQRSIHKVQPQYKGSLRCPERNCQYISTWHSDLRTHLRTVHKIHLEEMKLTFPSMNEFTKWREEEESSSKSMFVAASAMKTLRDGSTRMYLNCHRSGTYKSRGNGKRKLKVQGSCKINRCCPASMKVESRQGTVVVHYFRTHCGHSGDVGDMTHLRLTKFERALIAGKLAQGVTFEHLLDNLQSSNIKRFNRFHLLTKKDLYNIQRNFKLQQPVAKEPETFEHWLEESLALGAQSPILYCKDRGAAYEEYHSMEDALEAEDFFLVLSNPLQRDLLAQFGSNVVCIDCAEVALPQELSLTSLVVLDEFEEPFPVAFCLSSRTDFVAFKRFFEALRERVGSVVASVLMTDDLPALYGAWGQVMGEYEHHLLCPWYTQRCWKRMLEKIPKAKKSKRLNASCHLKTLLETNETERFDDRLTQFFREMEQDDDCSLLASHFRSQFALRPEMWAHCYLGPKWTIAAGRMETMHQALRSAFSQGRDLARCVTSLCRLVRDGNCARLAKQLDEGKAVQSPDDHTDVILEVIEEEQMWNLRMGCDEPVQVQRVSRVCFVPNCNKSNCSHIYSCSCVDYMAFSKRCPHIATVAQFQANQEAKKPLSSRVEEKMEMLLGFLKKGKVADALLEQMEGRIDHWLLDARSGGRAQGSSETLKVRGHPAKGCPEKNVVLLICPPSVNLKVPITRYKSPLEKDADSRKRDWVHSGFDHVY